MKKAEKVASVVIGFLLFIIAAVFSVGLLVQLLDFGAGSSGQQNGLYQFGEMLVSVYGVSSIFIPVFLIVAGIFCFSDKWSVQKACCLLVSIIPFFTLAIAERICRSIADSDEGPVAVVKIISLLVIAVLIVVAEYLVTLVLAGLSKKRKDAASQDSISASDAASTSRKVHSGEDTISISEDDGEQKESSASKWSFKSIFEGGKKNEADDSNDDEINAAVDKSISEATSSDWTLEELLKNNKKKEPLDEDTNKKLSTDSKYGKYDSGNYVKEAVVDEAMKEMIPEIASVSELEPAAPADAAELDDIESLMEEASVISKSDVALATDDQGRAEDANALPDVNDIMALDNPPEENDSASDDSETAPEDEDFADNATAPASATPAAAKKQPSGTLNVNADPWNVTEQNAEQSDINDITSLVDDSVPSANDIDLDDPAGLVENNTPVADTAPVAETAPAVEANSEDFSEPQSELVDGVEPDQQLTDNFESLIDDISPNEDSAPAGEADASSKEVAGAPGTDKTPPNFGKGSGIEEEPKNPNTASEKHAMLSVLDNVFAKMDMDAKADVEADDTTFNPVGPAVVDSNGNLKSKQINSSLTIDDDVGDAILATASVGGASRAAVAAASGAPTATPLIPRAVPKRVKHGPYKIPTELLTAYADNPYWIIDTATNMAAQNLKETLNEFKIEAEVTGIRKGPVVTMFEILPAPGVKLSKIVALQDNLALRLAASSIRIVAPIPGKRAVGIEVPNKDRAIVSFRECIEQNVPEWKKMAVPVVLGKDIQGESQIIDLVKTPHLLIAGSTGSGKSVCVNSMILSILYKRSPNEVKMILIDPKIVELKLYNDIPHLLTPVITEPKRAMQALQYCLCEMERRYALLDGLGVRDIANYNKRITERKICTEKLPYIVVIIDEFADLMATTGKELEGIVARLAAMSRAVGIHLVLATQRPSIDVITGLIKANIPSRIAFMVASKTDSRIIIDQVGAEKLLGKGDMLYSSSTDPFPVRIQGTFVSDTEVEDVVEAVKQWGEPEYIDDEIFVDDDEDDSGGQMSLFSDGEDPLYEKALDIVVQAGKASASYIQRRLKIGYNRAARLVEEMEDRGIVGPANGSKPREIIHMP